MIAFGGMADYLLAGRGRALLLGLFRPGLAAAFFGAYSGGGLKALSTASSSRSIANGLRM